MTSTQRPGSKLISLGVLLMLLGIFGPGQLENLLKGVHQPVSLPLALIIDALKAGFFLGLGAVVIGILRNRASGRKKDSV